MIVMKSSLQAFFFQPIAFAVQPIFVHGLFGTVFRNGTASAKTQLSPSKALLYSEAFAIC